MTCETRSALEKFGMVKVSELITLSDNYDQFVNYGSDPKEVTIQPLRILCVVRLVYEFCSFF
jgi:hypothetical protein